MSDEIITKALLTRLKAFADAQTPKLVIAYEGVAFTPDATKTHLAEFTLPANTDNPSMGRSHSRYIGIYQVDVDMPTTAGPMALRKLANAVAAHFPRGLTITHTGLNVLITNTPSIGPLMPESGRAKRSVSIRYQSDVFA